MKRIFYIVPIIALVISCELTDRLFEETSEIDACNLFGLSGRAQRELECDSCQSLLPLGEQVFSGEADKIRWMSSNEILFISDHNLYKANVSNGSTSLLRIGSEENFIKQITYSKDGSHVYFTQRTSLNQTSLYQIDSEGGEAQLLYDSIGQFHNPNLVVSPNNNFIGYGEETSYVFDKSSNGIKIIFEGTPLIFSPDSKYLLTLKDSVVTHFGDLFIESELISRELMIFDIENDSLIFSEIQQRINLVKLRWDNTGLYSFSSNFYESGGITYESGITVQFYIREIITGTEEMVWESDVSISSITGIYNPQFRNYPITQELSESFTKMIYFEGKFDCSCTSPEGMTIKLIDFRDYSITTLQENIDGCKYSIKPVRIWNDENKISWSFYNVWEAKHDTLRNYLELYVLDII